MVKEITVGTLVLVMDAHAKRHTWPLGLVTSVHRSEDGVVRAVRVRTKCGEGQRPTTVSRNVRELIPLTMFDNADECPTPRKSDMDTRAKVGIAEMTDAEDQRPSLPSTDLWKRSRHHHERPPPWGRSAKPPAAINIPRPQVDNDSSREAAILQISHGLFPQDGGTVEAVEAAKNTESTGGPQNNIETRERHNTEIKTRWTMGDNEKESNDHGKPPRNNVEDKQKSGSHNNIPSHITQQVVEDKTVKKLEKTPTTAGPCSRKSGNTSQENDGGELPDILQQKGSEKSQKEPECMNIKSAQGNDEEQLQGEPGAKTTKRNVIKPKRKYKTEVEKLREQQNGLEVTTSRRSDVVATVEGTQLNQCESNVTKNKGDGPKTGVAE
jgi:hypothetical protein